MKEKSGLKGLEKLFTNLPHKAIRWFFSSFQFFHFWFTNFAFHTHNETNTLYFCALKMLPYKSTLFKSAAFHQPLLPSFSSVIPNFFSLSPFLFTVSFPSLRSMNQIFSWQPNESLILVAFYCYIFLYNIPVSRLAACSAGNAAHFTFIYWLQNNQTAEPFKIHLSYFIHHVLDHQIDSVLILPRQRRTS